MNAACGNPITAGYMLIERANTDTQVLWDAVPGTDTEPSQRWMVIYRAEEMLTEETQPLKNHQLVQGNKRKTNELKGRRS